MRHILCALLLLPLTAQAAPWTGVWGAAPALPTGPEIARQTIRQPIHLSRPESRLRVKIDNALGLARLSIGAAALARPGEKPGEIAAGSAVALTFGGKPSVSIAPGQEQWSDPVTVPRGQDVVLDLYVDRATGVTATHPLGKATSFISDNGNQVGQVDLGPAEQTSARLFATMIAADDPDARGTVVAFGDSITDGARSTNDANARYPDALARRLAQVGIGLGVVNAGIAGNRLLADMPLMEEGPRAEARFARDALGVPGVRAVILLEGINDIGLARASGLPEQIGSASRIIASLTRLVQRAHTHGVRVIGGTLLPFLNTDIPDYASPEGEKTRQAVNAWIRQGHVFDGVADFDAALRDPADPVRLKPAFAGADHLHPNDAGYAAMAEAVDLSLLGAGR